MGACESLKILFHNFPIVDLARRCDKLPYPGQQIGILESDFTEMVIIGGYGIGIMWTGFNAFSK